MVIAAGDLLAVKTTLIDALLALLAIAVWAAMRTWCDSALTRVP